MIRGGKAGDVWSRPASGGDHEVSDGYRPAVMGLTGLYDPDIGQFALQRDGPTGVASALSLEFTA